MSCFWRDGYGNRYEFEVFEPPFVRWNKVGGIYIMVEPSADGRLAYAVYVGQTNNFSERLNGHEMWRTAKRLGATQIHALVVRDGHLRDEIERDLIEHLSPRLNVRMNRLRRALRQQLAQSR